MNPGQEAHEEDSSDSEADDPCTGQDTKLQESQSQPSSTSHRPRSSSNRAAAAWSADSGSDDSRRWSDQLSLDEKDGFIFVNYSEGQAKMHPHAQVNHPHPSYAEARHYSKLKPGKRNGARVLCQLQELSAVTHKAVCLSVQLWAGLADKFQNGQWRKKSVCKGCMLFKLFLRSCG